MDITTPLKQFTDAAMAPEGECTTAASTLSLAFVLRNLVNYPHVWEKLFHAISLYNYSKMEIKCNWKRLCC